ncbi:hypothetical protein CF319_g7946 [Tilletia indica]|nr:hypothetical protein CF319_g7946 [Tilletia indica]
MVAALSFSGVAIRSAGGHVLTSAISSQIIMSQLLISRAMRSRAVRTHAHLIALRYVSGKADPRNQHSYPQLCQAATDAPSPNITSSPFLSGWSLLSYGSVFVADCSQGDFRLSKNFQPPTACGPPSTTYAETRQNHKAHHMQGRGLEVGTRRAGKVHDTDTPHIERDGSGRVTLVPEENEDMHHLYNLIEPGDLVRAAAVRRVQSESNTGSIESHQVKLTLTIEVTKTSFDTSASSAPPDSTAVGRRRRRCQRWLISEPAQCARKRRRRRSSYFSSTHPQDHKQLIITTDYGARNLTAHAHAMTL